MSSGGLQFVDGNGNLYLGWVNVPWLDEMISSNQDVIEGPGGPGAAARTNYSTNSGYTYADQPPAQTWTGVGRLLPLPPPLKRRPWASDIS